MAGTIYKIMSRADLAEARKTGWFDGSADDRHHGFIHFSAGKQLAGTLERHFAGQGDLVLLAVAADTLGASLKWEPSRGGDLFPHLYAPLQMAHILWVEELPLGEHGRHLLPAGVAP